jgi:hypothetical protein
MQQPGHYIFLSSFYFTSCDKCFSKMKAYVQRKIGLFPQMTSLWWEARNFMIFCLVKRRLEQIKSGDLSNLFSALHQIILGRIKWGRLDGRGMQHAQEKWEFNSRKLWREDIILETQA